MKNLKSSLLKHKFLYIIIFLCVTLFVVLYAVPTLSRVIPTGQVIKAYWDGSVASSFRTGSGTQDNPYVISSPSEFMKLFTDGCGQTRTTYYRLNSDIYFNPGEFNYLSNGTYTYEYDDTVYYLNPSNNNYYSDSAMTNLVGSVRSTASNAICYSEINGNNHMVYGLYTGFSSSLVNSLFYSSFSNIGFINYLNSNSSGNSFFVNTASSGFSWNNVVFDGTLIGSNTSLFGSVYYSYFNNMKISGNLIGNKVASIALNLVDTTISNTQVVTNLKGNQSAAGFVYDIGGTSQQFISDSYFGGSFNTNTFNGFFATKTGSTTLKNITNSFITSHDSTALYAYTMYGMSNTLIMSGTARCTRCYESVDSNIDTGHMDLTYVSADSMMGSSFMNNVGLPTTSWRSTTALPELKLQNDTTAPSVTLSLKASYLENGDVSVSTKNYTTSFTPTNTIVADGNVNVTATTSDTSPITYIGFYESSSVISNPSTINYTKYTHRFDLTDANGTILYFKVTDMYGNTKYVNTDRITTMIPSSLTVQDMDGNSITSLSTVSTKNRLVYTYTRTSNMTFTDEPRTYLVFANPLPIGTRILLTLSGDTYDYLVLKNNITELPLESFNRLGSKSTSTYIEYPAGSASYTLMFDFSRVSNFNGNISCSIKYRSSTTLYSSSDAPSYYLTSNNAGISISQAANININIVGNYSVGIVPSYTNYTGNELIQNGYYYLVLHLEDANGNKITNGFEGIEVTYNNHNYYADSDGNINIIIGSKPSLFSYTFKVLHLNSTLEPGTYYLKSQLIVSDGNNKIASNETSSSLSISYITPALFQNSFNIFSTLNNRVLLYGGTNNIVSFDMGVNMPDGYDISFLTFDIHLRKSGSSTNLDSLTNISALQSVSTASTLFNLNSSDGISYTSLINSSLNKNDYVLHIIYKYKGSIVQEKDVQFIIK